MICQYQLPTLEMSYISLQPGRVGLIDTTYRWKFPIPYILSDSLGRWFSFAYQIKYKSDKFVFLL